MELQVLEKIKRYCEEHENCDNCDFCYDTETDRKICSLSHYPYQWDLEVFANRKHPKVKERKEVFKNGIK